MSMRQQDQPAVPSVKLAISVLVECHRNVELVITVQPEVTTSKSALHLG